MKTPKAVMPPEWAPHEATWLAWPYGDESFAGRMQEVEAAYQRILAVLARHEMIRLIVRSSQKVEVAEKLFKAGIPKERIALIEADYADVWTRDWGPTFVDTDGAVAYIKWSYNAYGNKFPALLKDDRALDGISRLAKGRIEAGFVMEGGAVEVNGAGIALTTEETLMNPNRNPGMTKDETEKRLKELLGLSSVVWLKQGLVNDHTDGHIDEVARFTDETTILYAWEDAGENHERMAENLSILRAARSTDGKPFTLIPLPLPVMHYDDGMRAPASYCNFYIGNGVVLVPEFGHENDARTKTIIQSALPEREVVGIPSRDLIYGGGGVHCITQQEPLASSG